MHNIKSCIHSQDKQLALDSLKKKKKTLMFSQKFGCTWTEFVSQDLRNLLI